MEESISFIFDEWQWNLIGLYIIWNIAAKI